MHKAYTILQAVGLSLCVQLVSYSAAPAKQEYISATASIAADGFISLDKAFTEINNNQLPKMGIKASSIQQSKYHMTLIGFDISLRHVSSAEKNSIEHTINTALNNATENEIKATIKALKKSCQKNKTPYQPITLKFDTIQIFAKKIVGIFKMSPVIQRLENNIEDNFRHGIQHLVNNGTITSINKHQLILLPHVSLGNILSINNQPVGKQNPFFGTHLQPQNVTVQDFKISKPDAITSIQWRT